jgi:hypothetical protein
MGFFTAVVGGLGLAAAGSQIGAGRAESAQAKYNAALYGQQAGLIEEQKGLEAMQFARAKRRMAATITARTAKAGLTMSGSPMAVMLDNLAQMEFDEAIGQYNLDIQKTQALGAQSAYGMQAKQAKRAGYTAGFMTMLSTAASMSMMTPKKGI